MENVEPRTLSFSDFTEVIAEVEHLYGVGYQQSGSWDLAQTCDHLAVWILFSLDGFPRPPLPMRMVLGCLRLFTGRRELERVLSSGQMARGAPTFRSSVFPPDGDPAEALQRLKLAVNRFESSAETVRPSPIYGRLTREQWRKLHLIHASHHLNILIG